MLLYLPFLAARNRSRRNLKKFSEVVASLGPTAPGSPSQEYTFPASARIAVSSDIDVPAGTVSLLVNGSSPISTPALTAGVVTRANSYIETGKKISIASSVPCTVSLFLIDFWSKPLKIAEAEVV
ncbi:MAG: hypothetical protein JKP92_08130 [Alphaproteobacteria bacterium]|jgi:hypothetical protein|nr:hypothetical protein [Alphaproteobacteria bacterium]